MDDYIYVALKINKETGEVIDMVKDRKIDKALLDEVLKLYEKLGISYGKDINHGDIYKKYSKYDYSKRTTLDNSTFAKI